MSLGWIKPEDFSFYSFLLMDRFQIRMMFQSNGWWNNHAEWRHCMGIALNSHPAVKWFFEHKCPEARTVINEITVTEKVNNDPVETRKAEIYVLGSVEDFVIYTKPELMDKNCDFIYGWEKRRLFEMADFSGKVVLDVGSGSGRLTFAAAEQAEWVYSSEPVDSLREYLRDKIKRENIKNIRVVDGMAESLPFPDNTFDIVMSGHVVGDYWDAEISELTRVCKHCGWLLDCPGDGPPGEKQNAGEQEDELIKRGWESMFYTGTLGGEIYRYRKKILK